MYSKVGFIGSGNMAGAIMGGTIRSGYLSADNIYISDVDKSKAQSLSDLYGVNTVENNREVIEKCEIIILSVKPHIYGTVLDEIKKYINTEKVIVTIAAGVTISYVKSFLGKEAKVIRTMPNTPALVGEGMTAITYTSPVESRDVDFVKGMFSSFGLVEIIDESLIDAFSSLCGSSPAFIDMFIEAMADAAVQLGLPRNKSYIMAAQAVKGTAKMLIDTGKHPGELKDMVCSPAGTTIEGVRVLEKKGLRSAVMEGIISSAEKAKLLGEKYK